MSRAAIGAALLLGAGLAISGGDAFVMVKNQKGQTMEVSENQASLLVEFDGTDDWADPSMDPKSPPRLRIPVSYMTPHALENARDGRLVISGLILDVPAAEAGFKSSPQYDLSPQTKIVHLSEVADGWALRTREAIDLAVESSGEVADETTGLRRVTITDYQGYSKRYRYFESERKGDLEYLHLDCTYYENQEQADTCMIQVMVARNLGMTLHFSADGVGQWRQRVRDMRALAARWKP